MSVTIGSLVWAEDAKVSWIDGEVVEIHGEKITISCTNGKTVSHALILCYFYKFCPTLRTHEFAHLQVVTNASKVYHKDAEASPCGVDDMTKLAYLHEPGVLQNLKSRYDMNEIYVSFSFFLIFFSIV